MIAYSVYAGRPPEDFGTGRLCERCGGGVMRFAKPQAMGTAGTTGPLLCSRCVSAFDPLTARLGKERIKTRRDGKKHPGVHLKALKAYRKGAGLSQSDLEGKLGYKRGAASKWESGGWKVSPDLQKEIADILGVAPEDLEEEGGCEAA